MKHILHIIGARPQIIKSAAISRAIKKNFAEKLRESIVHTGQHYDKNMSNVFFDEMDISKPDYELDVGSLSHGKQTALMIEKIEKLLFHEKPDYVILYGDTNSTLAGSIAASKLNIPIIHIEAGLRSFNKSMPEEINRIVCDHTSTLLFTPTRTGLNNLINEGFKPHNNPPYSSDNPGIFHCGDIMLDNSLYYSKTAEGKSKILEDNKLQKGKFILGTIHRDNNTDTSERLNEIFNALNEIANQEEIDIVLPLHPRTSKILKQNLKQELYEAIFNSQFIKIIPPASFFDILVLEKYCKMVITDSGGLQKEAYFFQKPVIVIRPETEWVEIIENKTGIIADANKENIIRAYFHFLSEDILDFPPVFGDGKAAEFICRKI